MQQDSSYKASTGWGQVRSMGTVDVEKGERREDVYIIYFWYVGEKYNCSTYRTYTQRLTKKTFTKSIFGHVWTNPQNDGDSKTR